MANELTTTIETGMELANVTREFKSKKLASQTRAIEKLMLATKKNMYEIAVRLVVIRDEELFVADGFNDVFDYAEQVLGYKRPMTYKMCQTADKYIVSDDNGKTYHSAFYVTGASEDYTVSQLMELNTLTVEQAKELNGVNAINPEMTTKDIRATVKEYKDELKAADKSAKGETTDETTDEATETVEPVEAPADIDEVTNTAIMVLQEMINNFDTLMSLDTVSGKPFFTNDVRERMKTDLAFYKDLYKAV